MRIMAVARRYTLILCLLSGSTGGCALSPQVVEIHPQLPAGAGAAATVAATLALEVRDDRKSPLVGYRGGVYETATITVAGDMAARLRSALADAFGQRGYDVVAADAPAPLRLSVAVVELGYSIRQLQLTRLVETRAALQARSQSGTTTRTGAYRDQRSLEVLKPPDTATNERLINETLDAALQRLLADTELLNFR